MRMQSSRGQNIEIELSSVAMLERMAPESIQAQRYMMWIEIVEVGIISLIENVFV